MNVFFGNGDGSFLFTIPRKQTPVFWAAAKSVMASPINRQFFFP
jgi:hypothetical protein